MKIVNKWNILRVLVAFAIGGTLTSCHDSLEDIKPGSETTTYNTGEDDPGEPTLPPPPPTLN